MSLQVWSSLTIHPFALLESSASSIQKCNKIWHKWISWRALSTVHSTTILLLVKSLRSNWFSLANLDVHGRIYGNGKSVEYTFTYPIFKYETVWKGLNEIYWMAYSKCEINVEGIGRIFLKYLVQTVHPASRYRNIQKRATTTGCKQRVGAKQGAPCAWGEIILTVIPNPYRSVLLLMW